MCKAASKPKPKIPKNAVTRNDHSPTFRIHFSVLSIPAPTNVSIADDGSSHTSTS